MQNQVNNAVVFKQDDQATKYSSLSELRFLALISLQQSRITFVICPISLSIHCFSQLDRLVCVIDPDSTIAYLFFFEGLEGQCTGEKARDHLLSR